MINVSVSTLYCTTIASYNYLYFSVLRPKFEKLFRLLFDLCPKKRGGGMNETGTRSWFECVQEILSTKVR